MPKITNVTAKQPKHKTNGVKEVKEITGIRNQFHEQSKHWWLLPRNSDEVASACKEIVIKTDKNNFELTQQFATFARMYGNYDNLGMGNAMGNADGMSYDATTNIPKYNVIQSSIDTLQSKICKDNPKPYFMSSGGDYFTKLRAEKQTQFVAGIFQESKLYDLSNNRVFLDGATYGLGGLKFELNKKGRIEAKWIFIDEVKVDQIDAMKKSPRSLHFCCLEQKEILLDKYPDSADIINDIVDDNTFVFRARDTVIELCVTIESYHLALGDTPGRHVVSLQDKVLLDEDYLDEENFPAVFFRYADKAMGFYGRGVAECLFNNQIEINKILLYIQQCQELQAVPIILVPNDAEIAPDVIGQNSIARIIPYRGTQAPSFITPQGAAPESYQHLLWWIQASYQEVGVSMTSATGKKEAGVNSAVAMRTMVDIESSRFVQVSKNWEKFFIDCAQIIMKLGKLAYEKDKDFKVTYMDKKSKIIKEIKWTDVGSPDDKFTIQCDSISSFPTSGAGRIQTITEFISNGWFGKERGMEMIGLDPDVDGELQKQTASLRLCEKRLSQMVEEQIYNHPEPYMDLNLSLKVSIQTYNQLVIDECPEERLQLVRRWMGELQTMIGNPDPTVLKLQSIFGDQQPQAAAPTPAQPQAAAPAQA